MGWESSIRTHEPLSGGGGMGRTLALEGYFANGKELLGLLRACVGKGLDDQKRELVRLGIWNGMEGSRKRWLWGCMDPACSPGLQDICYLSPIAHPVKALLAAPSGHLCEHGSWEEAAGLHVVRNLLQAL